MVFIFALLGLLAMLAGGAAIGFGWPAVPLEYGWTLVIAGSASASGGLVCLAIAGLIFETRRMRFALAEALARQPAAEPLPVEAQLPVDAATASRSEAPPALKPKEAGSRPTEIKPAEAKPAETKPIEIKFGDSKPFEAKPFETKPYETKSLETKPIETKLAEIVPQAEAKPEPAAKIEPAKIEPAMTFGRILEVASSTPSRVELQGFGKGATPSPAAAEPAATVATPPGPAPSEPARPEPVIQAAPTSPRPLRFEPKVVATRPAAPRIEPAPPGKADARPSEAELQDDAEAETESHALDGHNGVGDMAAPDLDGDEGDELRPARSFSVGETTFIVFTDGSIEARTPKGSQRFDTMEDVRAYLHQAVH